MQIQKLCIANAKIWYKGSNYILQIQQSMYYKYRNMLQMLRWHLANNAYIGNIQSEHLYSISVFAIHRFLYLQYIIGAFISYFCICNTHILYLQYIGSLKFRFCRSGLCVLVVGGRPKLIVSGMKWVAVARNELILWENEATPPNIILKLALGLY